MSYAVDTNILLDVLLPDPAFAETSIAALDEARREAGLVVCDIVVAELGGQLDSAELLRRFLKETGLRVAPMRVETCWEAGATWRRYRRRQRGVRDRIVPDFMVGAHALREASGLLTRDLGFYRANFPTLKIWPQR